MIYCGKKSELEKFNRIYKPKDLIIEFKDDGSERKVRMKTGRMDYSDYYLNLPYLTCGCQKDRYEFNTYIAKDTWLIKHNMKGWPMIQLYKYGKSSKVTETTNSDGVVTRIKDQSKQDERINGEIHYLDKDTIEVKFSEPVAGYAVLLLLHDGGYVYHGTGSTWLIQHDLGDVPFVQIYNEQNELINGEIIQLDENTTQINFYEGRDYEVTKNEESLRGFDVKVTDRIPKSVTGYAVLIVTPSSQYVHHQTEPSKYWRVRHNLNNYVITQILNPELYVKLTSIKQINKSTTILEFSEEVTGHVLTASFNSSSNSQQDMGGVIVVDQYELPDVAEAKTNTIYVIKQTGFAYVTNDNFQWITVTPGPTRVDGNLYKNEEGMEVDGNKFDKHTWEDKSE